MKTIKHSIVLTGFDLEKGKISFSLLEKLSKQFVSLAESVLLSYVEGHGDKSRGKAPEWLVKSVDFSLSGIKEGSTILEVEAPALKDTLGNIQLPVYSDISIEKLQSNSSLGLSMYAFELAMEETPASPLLNKALLKEMEGFNRFLHKTGTSIDVTTAGKRKPLHLKKESLAKIKAIEEHTPPSFKTHLTGKLDVMKHTSNQMEIVTDNKRIRAFLKDNLAMEEMTNYFGKEITATGIAHFNPMRQLSSFEIHSVRMATDNDAYFRQIPASLFAESEMIRLIKHQDYKGFNKTKFDKLIDELDVQEPLEDLLKSLKS